MRHEEILEKVCRSVDILSEAGETYEGLFPSVLSLTDYRMLAELPSPIDGQRTGDRSYPGSNLIHDEALLMTMYALGESLGRDDYTRTADRYLKRFATHCTDTVTGLFPWGEHAFWHLTEDCVAGSIHDHLRQAPLWLWEKLYQSNSRCVERFGEGLNYHWKDEARTEYSRHANITARERQGWGERSCDFPRHSGFYIFDWSFAYLKTGRPDFLDQIVHISDYWWEKRDEQGLLLIESRSPQTRDGFHRTNAPGQTASLAASLLESADPLEPQESELARQMRQRAATYIDGFFAAPHDLEKGIFVITCKQGSDVAVTPMPIWGSRYGLWPASYVALVCLCAYRMTHDERLLLWSESVGGFYTRLSFPQDVAVPAMDAGLGLGLLADLYHITGDDAWLEDGLTLAQQMMNIYFDHALPRGASGINWYESQMEPSFLLHSLARIALLSIDRDNCPLAADYTAR